jgi:hypothetical protein
MVTSAAPSSARRTHCPVCGAKIARAELSICSYCASPLDLLERRRDASGDDAGPRLAKLRAHSEFAAALEFTPPDQGLGRRLRSRARGGLALAALGLLAVGAGLARGTPPATGLGWFALGFGLALLLTGGLRLFQAARAGAKRRALPLLRRAALVRDRRSETSVSTWAWRARTAYYFKLALEDGLEAEFVYPGRGGDHELLVPGNTGVAYTRGTELVDFRKLKV